MACQAIIDYANELHILCKNEIKVVHASKKKVVTLSVQTKAAKNVSTFDITEKVCFVQF